MGAADPSAGVLELGVVLLLAAVLGRGARAAGLPAVIGYLAVGLLVSPFTPGFVADREQLDLLGQIGVALLLFEVGIEVDPLSLRRSGRHLVWVVPLHTVGPMAAASLAAAALGLPWRGALLVGLAVTLSSSVVVVNITRSPRRATNDATGQSLLGWSVVPGRDRRGAGGRSPRARRRRRQARVGGPPGDRRLRGARRGGCPRPAAGPSPPPGASGPVPAALGGRGPLAGRDRRARLRRAARPVGLRRGTGDQREPRDLRGPRAPPPVPRPVRGVVLRRRGGASSIHRPSRPRWAGSPWCSGSSWS